MTTAPAPHPAPAPTAGNGEIVNALLASGDISTDDLALAATSATDGQSLLESLVERGLVEREHLLGLAAESAGTDYVDLSETPVDPAATSLITTDFARRAGVVPIALDGATLRVAVPLRKLNDLELKDDVARMSGRRCRFVLASRADIEYQINRHYRAEGELASLGSDLEVDDEPEDLESFIEVSEDAPVVRFVNLLISQAIDDRASDIHLEPTETDLRVRYRVDGVLVDAHRAPRSIVPGVISRFKIMSDLNIAEKRVPQDGRLTINRGDRTMDLRVATLPTVWGEKIVARVLDNSNTRMALSDLGFSQENFERFGESYRKPYGMILVTGPTGSGKSTTLYATLNILNQPHVNVITVEDPVEYRLPGINQVQTNPKAGLTFAAALRSILRSDPDIVLIGEIRDHETATIAIEASLTGHLVLSTLHTNDAPSAVTRLIEMGVEPFLVGSALDSVVGQRLCRSLCGKCKVAYRPEPAEQRAVGMFIPEHVEHIYRAQGCSSCGGTGYRGRMALHEVMSVTDDIERLAVRRATTEEIVEAAAASGMSSLREDGWAKVLAGRTTIEEVLRVVG